MTDQILYLMIITIYGNSKKMKKWILVILKFKKKERIIFDF